MNREIKIGTILSWVPQKDGSFEHRNGTIVIVQELAVKKFGTLKVISSKTDWSVILDSDYYLKPHFWKILA